MSLEENEPLFSEDARAEIETLLGSQKYGETLEEFVRDVEAMLSALPNLELGDQISEVHKVSGVSGMLGMLGMHQHLLASEVKGKEGDNTGFEEGVAAFIAHWPKRREELEHEISGLKAL